MSNSTPSRAVDRKFFAGEFRTIAAQFTRAAERCRDGNAPQGRAEATYQQQRLKRVSSLLVSAGRKGYLPTLPALQREIEWLDGGPAPTKRPPNWCRVEVNVWFEFIGGNTLRVFNNGGKIEVVGDACGGILPETYPEAFPPLPYSRLADGDEDPAAFHRFEAIERLERAAAACRLVAELIEGSTEDAGEECERPPDYDALDHEILKALDKAHPVRLAQNDIVTLTNIGHRETVGKHLKKLHQHGLADYPAQTRKAGITPTGQEYARRNLGAVWALIRP